MKPKVVTFYAVGERIWYRQVAQTNIHVAGVIEDITIGSPTASYAVRLENKDRIWAEMSQLLPRYR
jgi:hypothetical protein